jgi:hypothetical protein
VQPNQSSYVSIQPVNGAGAWLFDWNPETGYIKAYARANGAEAGNDALNAVGVWINYMGV